jgi:vacuolar-type H+-ATPase subunit I/STV1
VLNSSNSNIEEEFEQIKEQILALSKNVNQLEKSTDQKGAEFAENQGEDSKKQAERDRGKSCHIFEYHGGTREFLRTVVSSVYFANFVYTLIALNSLLLMLDEP